MISYSNVLTSTVTGVFYNLKDAKVSEMTRWIVYEDTCKGCGLCVTVCPKKILALDTGKLNKKGYHPVGITDQDSCISCASCARMCPDAALEIHKPDSK